MGVFICGTFSPDTTDEMWRPVYEESLEMARAFGLIEIGYQSIHGVRCPSISSVAERNYGPDIRGNDEVGWTTNGDAHSLQTCEDQYTPKYLGAKEGATYADPILERLWRYGDDIKNLRWLRIWGYYPATRIKTNTNNSYWVVYAIISNDDFHSFALERAGAYVPQDAASKP